jgi:hypothetical protein
MGYQTFADKTKKNSDFQSINSPKISVISVLKNIFFIFYWTIAEI